MVFLNDSLSIILLGDWNKLYIQPDWIANKIYEEDEIELEVNGQGSDFGILYRCNDIVIRPTQSKMSFEAANTNEKTLEYLTKYVNNYLNAAYTPYLIAYGINGEFIDDDESPFANVLDKMSDSNAIIETGYTIMATTISRSLSKNDKVINMEFRLDNSRLHISFNEHHSSPTENPVFDSTIVKAFITECVEILQGLGYELEEE